MAVKLAIDISGGDNAPEFMLKGVAAAASELRDLTFRLFASKQHTVDLSPYPHLKDRATLVVCEDLVDSHMKPTAALRLAHTSSMGQAILDVKDGGSQGVVSAGNTGAYMALAKVILKTMDGIDRPAIAGTLPTLKGKSIMLDMGANVDASADILFQFAMMGEVFARIMLGKETPSVGLLNIGEEQLKGNAVVKEAHALLQENFQGHNYHGFIEGDDIMLGTTDVIVTDGFTGNIALKAIEGTVKFFVKFLKSEIGRSNIAKIGAFVAGGALKNVKSFIDPSRYNGALLMGLNGVVVKSHGSANEYGFSRAIHVAYELAKNDAISQVQKELANLMTKCQS